VVVAHPLDDLEELLRIAVGDVEADAADGGRLGDGCELLEIGGGFGDSLQNPHLSLLRVTIASRRFFGDLVALGIW